MAFPTAAANIRAGAVDRALEATAVEGDGMGGAIDAATGKPGTNLIVEAGSQRWKTTDATPANTRAHLTLPQVVTTGIDAIGGFNCSESAMIRITRDDEFVERWSVSCAASSGDVTSAADLTVTAAYTVMFWVRLDTQKWDGSFLSLCYVGTANGDTTRDFLIGITTGGLFQALSNRKTSGNVVVTGTTTPLDGAFHHLAVTHNDATGDFSFYVDGALVGTEAEVATVPATGTDKLSFPGTATDAFVIAGSVSYWTQELSAATVAATRKLALLGTEPALELLWHVDEGTSTALADETGNSHAGTLGAGCAWMRSMVNPAASYSSGIVAVWHPYRTRKYVSFDGANDDGRTAASLSNSLSMSFMAWVYIEPAVPVATQVLANFGTGITSTTCEFYLRRLAGGTVSVRIGRYDSGAAGFVDTPSITLSVGWHRFQLSLDGVADVSNLYWDGVISDANRAGNPYSAKTSQRFSLGADTTQTVYANTCICGDIIVMNRTTVAADDPIYTRIAPEADPTVYLHYTMEEEAATIVNRGSAGVIPLTLTAGTWKTDGQSPVDPSGVWMDGDVPGQKVSLRALGYDVAEAAGRYILLEIWDPDNADGFVEVGRLMSYESYDYGSPSGNSTLPVPVQRTVSGAPFEQLGPPLNSISVEVEHTDGPGMIRWREAAERAAKQGHRALIVAGTEERWPVLLGTGFVAYGIPDSVNPRRSIQNLLSAYPHSASLTVIEVP